ncbi:hypothetical protein ACFFQF_03980 [Haladaptatus pallidirubidus]
MSADYTTTEGQRLHNRQRASSSSASEERSDERAGRRATIGSEECFGRAFIERRAGPAQVALALPLDRRKRSFPIIL